MKLRPSLLWRYLAGTFTKTSFATIGGVLAVVLVVDFADRAYSFKGEGWVLNVIRLYVNLAADFGYQVAPGALVLAAGITVSGLRAQGELTAFNALGNRPMRMIGTVLTACGLVCVGIVLINEWVVVSAAARAEDIKRNVFGRKPGDFRAYLEQQKWFRSGDRVYNLRQSTESGFADVSLYELDREFRLVERIDAATMDWDPAAMHWRLGDVTVSRFGDGLRTSAEKRPEMPLMLPESLDDLRIKAGKPRQMSIVQLYDQIRLRKRLGLDDLEFRHELYNRLAYPFAAVPGSLIAIRLALRRNRSGHLAMSMAEALGISLAMFTLWTVFRALGISGALPPGLAAVSPLLVLLAIGVATDLGQRWALRRPIPASA
ncbi:MAG TPA: LptF/LptG family permease [Vulgatibacter sp.]